MSVPDADQRPWVIALANQKGGQGKSTTVLNLASLIEESSGRALVADADPQATASDLAASAVEPFPFEVRPAPRAADIERLAEIRGYDTVLIDTPGSLADTPLLAAVLTVADYAIVPITPEAASVRPTMRTVEAFRSNGVPVRVLLSQTDPMKGAAPVEDMRRVLESSGVPVFRTSVRRYSVYPNSQQEGLPITAYRGGKWQAALDDLSRVHGELLLELGRLSNGVKAGT
jgi:chromosome partitioning protein